MTYPPTEQHGETALRAAIRRFREDSGDSPLRIRLYDAMRDRCSLEDLQATCFMLGIDWEQIDGDTRPAKARHLISHYEHRDELERLAYTLKRQRPDLEL